MAANLLRVESVEREAVSLYWFSEIILCIFEEQNHIQIDTGLEKTHVFLGDIAILILSMPAWSPTCSLPAQLAFWETATREIGHSLFLLPEEAGLLKPVLKLPTKLLY